MADSLKRIERANSIDLSGVHRKLEGGLVRRICQIYREGIDETERVGAHMHVALGREIVELIWLNLV